MSYIPGWPTVSSPSPMYVQGTDSVDYDPTSFTMIQQVDLGNTVPVVMFLVEEAPGNLHRAVSSYSGTIVISGTGPDLFKEGVTFTSTVTVTNGETLTLQKQLDGETYYWVVVSRNEGIKQTQRDSGTATLDSTGSVVVLNSNVTPSTHFALTIQDTGSVPTNAVYVSARSVGTSFTISSIGGSSDAGVVVFYHLWENFVY